MGATIYVKNQPAIGTTTGLDGTFVLKNLPANQRVTLVCSYISYQPIEVEVRADAEEPILFALESAALGLDEVTVIASNPGRTEAGARGIERQAMNVVNVISERQLTATLSTGYNAMYLNRDFQSFNTGAIVKQSPYEAMGKPEDYKVTEADFTNDNLHMKWS